MEHPHEDLDDWLDLGLSAAFELEPGGSGAAPRPGSGPAAPAAEEEPLPGVVAGHPVSGVVGRGGSGIVLRATDALLDRPLAIKILRARHADDADLVARFEREAHISARLEHPGVVPVHAIGRLPDGRPYFTMTLVEGETLDARLARGGTAGRERTRLLDVFRKVCETVAYAHARGVVHRDLKPRNVMLGTFGEVLVMDWGFAQESGGDGAPSAGPRARIVGTPSYMSPEQARGAPVDARADVFALGGILCEILTGAPPYTAETTSELLLAASRGWSDEAKARLAASGADAFLVDLVHRCLDPDPAARPAQAAEVAEAVASHLHELEERAHRQEVELAEARARAGEERRARKLTLALATAVVATVLVAAGAWMILEARDADRRQRNAREVSEALERSALLVGEAQAREGARPDDWRRAQDATRWARDLSHRLFPEGHPRRRQAEALHARASSGLRDATRDRATTERLIAIRGHYGDQRSIEERCQAYERAFRDQGVDLRAAAPEEAAEALRGERPRAVLATALDDWLRLAVMARGAIAPGRLLDVANRLDGDPWRRRVREGLAVRDAAALAALADTADASHDDASSLVLLGAALSLVGERERAVRTLRRAHALRPDDAWLNHDLGMLLREEDPEGATFHFGMAVARLGDNVHLLVDLAQVLLVRDREEAARDYLERALRLSPEDASAWYYVGMMALRQERLDDALAAFDRCLAADPAFALAVLGRGMVLQRLGRLEEALAFIEASVDRGRRDVRTRVLLGSLRLELGHLGAAETVFLEIVAAAPKTFEAWRGLGQIRLRTLRWREGREALERAAALAPDAPEILCELGNALVLTGRFEEGLEKLERGHALGRAREAPWPWPSDRWISQAEDCLALEDALVRNADPGLPPGQRDALALARVAAITGRHATAFRLYSGAFADHPRAARAGLVPHRLLAARAGLASGTAAARAEVLGWLEADLEQLREVHELSTVTDDDVLAAVVAFWSREPAFASVREDDGLSALPESERARWKAFWASVADFRASLAPR